jgi:hypothetical protein
MRMVEFPSSPGIKQAIGNPETLQVGDTWNTAEALATEPRGKSGKQMITIAEQLIAGADGAYGASLAESRARFHDKAPEMLAIIASQPVFSGVSGNFLHLADSGQDG